jgi:hypothetical protein
VRGGGAVCAAVASANQRGEQSCSLRDDAGAAKYRLKKVT